MENNYMDKMVRDAIGEYETNVPSSNWDEMEMLLDKDTDMRRRLYMAKGIEVFLMVFAIWTVMQFVQTDAASSSHTEANAPTIIESSEQPNAPVILDNEEQKEAKPSDALQNGNQNDKQPATYNGQPFAQLPSTSSQQSKAIKVDNKLNDNKNNLPIAKQVHNNKDDISNKDVLVLDNQEEKVIASILDFSEIASLDTRLLQNDAYTLSPLEPLIIKKKSKWKLGAFASLDWFNIKPDESVAAVSKQAQAINPGIALRANYQLANNIDLEFGVGLSKRQHRIRTNTPFVNQTSSGILAEIQDINTYVLEVPVDLKYNFKTIGDTKFYALAGVSNYLIMDVDNKGVVQELYLGSSIVKDPNFVTNSPREPVQDLGLLEEGTLPSNHYVSLNGGLGVEHSIGKRKNYTIFAQAQYKQGVFKTGRHEDRISALALATGVKRSF